MLKKILSILLNDKLIMELLNNIIRVSMNETLDTRQAVIMLELKNKKTYSLWLNGRAEQTSRHIAFIRHSSEKFPEFPAGSYPKEPTINMDATVRTVTPY